MRQLTMEALMTRTGSRSGSASSRSALRGTVVVLLGALGAVSACGGSDQLPVPTALRVTGISILGPPEVAPGTSATFSAVETLSNGTNRPVTQPVQFTSSDTAVLTIDNSGLAVALKVGETTLSVRTASQPGGMLPVMVLPPGTYRL